MGKHLGNCKVRCPSAVLSSKVEYKLDAVGRGDRAVVDGKKVGQTVLWR